jgi:hypothetical protein
MSYSPERDINGQTTSDELKELTRLDIMQRIEERGLNQKVAAEALKVTERHVSRLLQAYRQSGAGGLVSRRQGKPNKNRLKAEVKQ